MPKAVKRKPQKITVDEFLYGDTGLPEKMELDGGMIGPFSDRGKLTLLANWGVDKVTRLTGPEIWREALAARDDAAGPSSTPKS